MPFPVSFKGTLSVPVTDSPGQVEAVMNGVVTALHKEKARNLLITGNEVRFTGGLLRLVSSDNQLVAISSGQIEISHEGGDALIRFRGTLTQLLVVASVMIGVIAYLFALPWQTLLLMWAWLFGGNYFLLRFRFPRFLRRAALTELDRQ
jgi:hypothetical protein